MESVEPLQGDRHSRLISNQVHHKAAAGNELLATLESTESGDRDQNESKLQEERNIRRTNFYRLSNLCLAIHTNTDRIHIHFWNSNVRPF